MFFMDLLEQRNINRRVLVLGAGRRAATLYQLRRRSDLLGFNLAGYVPSPADEVAVPAENQLRPAQPLPEFVRAEKIDLIIVAVDDRRGALPMAELLDCRTQGVEVVDLVSFLEQETGRIKLDVMHPGWLAFSRGFRHGLMRGIVKRAFDVMVSLLILVATLPITLLTALAIWIEAGGSGPIFYRQMRVGAGGKVFPVFKFRSMRPDAEKDGKARWAQPGDARVTVVGRFIRKYRIDELPQLLNILRGDMSFVGPRPERPEFVATLTQSLPYYRERHRVKPGLTGWAQICYPYGASEQDAFEKLQFDLYYVKNHSLLLDLTVLLQTAEVVLWGKGAR
jgi:sugar transferase (PEP-CTERM system associated)